MLVNNAGGAHGLEPIAEADDEHWRTMWESNVFGLMLVTRALLPKLIDSGNGHIVNIGSVAGFEVYPGGAGYTSASTACGRSRETLRLELLGKPVRVTEIDPGMVETEFSLVRFGGDEAARIEGLRRPDAAHRGRHRRLRALRCHPPEARRHRPHGRAPHCAGYGEPGRA